MEKINDLKKLLNDFNLDGYIVPKNDEFFNEYISPDKDRLKYITNFSGSFGLAVLERKKNYLFVDGRYTFQAKKQSGKLFNIITIPKKLPLDIFKNKKLKIGFDPKLHTQKTLDFFFKRNNCRLIPIKENLVDKIWIKKSNEKASKFYVLPNEAVGKSYLYKLNKVINILKKKRVDIQFISSNENIAWLLNIRGRDSEFTPIPNAYAILSKNKKVIFFCNLKKINKSFKNKFKNIEFVDIKLIYFFLKAIKNKKVLIDSSSCSIYFENILKKENSLISHPDPIYFLKSIKSKIEIKNTIKSHVYDGAALTNDNNDKGGFAYPMVNNVVDSVKVDTSYAADYFPDVVIEDGGKRKLVPATVAALSAIGFNDNTSFPWFAPAGFTRGALGSVVESQVKFNRNNLDELYSADINPLTAFPHTPGVVVFGQKTLQETSSALDRINVRRLVIYLKKQISIISSSILFEQNVQTTWNRFKGLVEPFLANVKTQFGITDYKLVLDETTTTADLVDRNILYAKVFIKPARAIEFIAIDFVITKTGIEL